MSFVVLVDLHAKCRRSRQKENLLLWPKDNLHVILKLSKHPCRQLAKQVGAKKESYSVSAPIRTAFHASKYARYICWISSGWACSFVWLERCWMCLPRALGGKLSPQSVFRSPPDRRTWTSVFKRSVFTCFSQGPCLTVGTQFPADLPLFLLTVCVWRLVQEMRKTRQLVRGEGWLSAVLERPCCCCCCSPVKHHPQGGKDEACMWIPSVNNAPCSSYAMQTDRMETLCDLFLVRTEYLCIFYIINDYLNSLHNAVVISIIISYWCLCVFSSCCAWMFTMHTVPVIMPFFPITFTNEQNRAENCKNVMPIIQNIFRFSIITREKKYFRCFCIAT